MTRYTSLGIRNNEHPVLHSEDKTSPETGIRKRDGNAYPARYNERRNRKNEKGLSGNFWLLSFKISYLCLPLFYETRTTPSCHPSGCAYRQL